MNLTSGFCLKRQALSMERSWRWGGRSRPKVSDGVGMGWPEASVSAEGLPPVRAGPGAGPWQLERAGEREVELQEGRRDQERRGDPVDCWGRPSRSRVCFCKRVVSHPEYICLVGH